MQLTDIDECELGSAMCHQNASCENTVGGYLCSCAVGLTGNGFNCSGKHLGIIIQSYELCCNHIYRRIRIIRPWAMHLRNPPKKGVGLSMETTLQKCTWYT